MWKIHMQPQQLGTSSSCWSPAWSHLLWDGILFLNQELLKANQHGCAGHSSTYSMPKLIPQVFNWVEVWTRCPWERYRPHTITLPLLKDVCRYLSVYTVYIYCMWSYILSYLRLSFFCLCWGVKMVPFRFLIGLSAVLSCPAWELPVRCECIHKHKAWHGIPVGHVQRLLAEVVDWSLVRLGIVWILTVLHSNFLWG